jgi:hypothetical protein
LHVHKIWDSNTRNDERFSCEKFYVGRGGDSERAVRYGKTAIKLVKAEYSHYSFFAAIHIRACAYKSVYYM